MKIRVEDIREIKWVRLSKIYDLSNFDCDNEDINDFLKNDALPHQEERIATTILFLYEEKILGFCSLATDALKLSQPERVKCIADQGDMKQYTQYPAIKIARFGRDKQYRNQGIGKNIIIPWVIGYVEDLKNISVRFITVDAKPERIRYYENLKFVRNEHKDYKPKTGRPVSMRFDLKTPKKK